MIGQDPTAWKQTPSRADLLELELHRVLDVDEHPPAWPQLGVHGLHVPLVRSWTDIQGRVCSQQVGCCKLQTCRWLIYCDWGDPARHGARLRV